MRKSSLSYGVVSCVCACPSRALVTNDACEGTERGPPAGRAQPNTKPVFKNGEKECGLLSQTCGLTQTFQHFSLCARHFSCPSHLVRNFHLLSAGHGSILAPESLTLLHSTVTTNKLTNALIPIQTNRCPQLTGHKPAGQLTHCVYIVTTCIVFPLPSLHFAFHNSKEHKVPWKI